MSQRPQSSHEPFPRPAKAGPGCHERLEHACRLGFAPRVVFDGGAHTGRWSKRAQALFPGAAFVLVEPNPHLVAPIRSNTGHFRPDAVIVEAALGDAPGRAALKIWDDTDQDMGASLLDHVRGPARAAIEVEVTTIDAVVERTGLVPDLIKLDLQGFELSALRGGTEALRHAEMLIVEFGCLKAYRNRTSPRDLLDLAYAGGFSLYDVVGLNYRPHDGALTGGDFILVRNDSALKAYEGWE